VFLCHPQLQQQFLLRFFFSGIRNKIPDAVFVSAATGSIRTRSESGLMFKAMILFFLIILVRSQSQKLCQPYYTDIISIKNASFDRLAFF
jgi:hypothetical protein